MAVEDKRSTGRKILKIAGIILAVFLSLVLLLSILLLTVLEPYAERFIKKKVSQKTEGLYHLQFADLDINLLTATVRLEEIQVTFDSTIHQEQKRAAKASPFLFNLKIEELEVSGIEALAYLVDSNVNIGSIVIDEPAAKVIHDKSVAKADKEKSNISEIVNTIGIGHFNLNQAEIAYFSFKNQKDAIHKIPHLNIRLDDLKADFLESRDFRRMIDVAEFFISLKEQTFVIANDAYTLKFNLFEYDTRKRELILEDFSAIGDHKKLKGPMIAPEIQVPLLKMRKLDLVEALKSKKLHFEELIIEETFVKLLEIPDLDITVADVYKGLSVYFESTKIDDFNIVRSSASMYSRKNKDVLIQKISYIDLLIDDVSFDSLSVFDSRNNLALQQLTINAEDYLLQPEESPYTFQVGKVEMETKNDELTIKSLSLTPDIQKNKELNYRTTQASPTLMNIKVPQIHFEGIDMIRAFANANLNIEKIDMGNSNVTIRKAFEKKPSDGGFSSEAIYDSFSFYVKEINIGELQVADADLSQHASVHRTQEVHQVKDGTLEIKGIHFDSTMAYQGIPKAPLQELLLDVQQYKFSSIDNSTFYTMGPVQYSTLKEELKIQDIQFESFADSKGHEADSIILSGLSLSVSDFNIVTAYNIGKLEIEEVLVESPNVFVSREAQTGKSTAEANTNAQRIPGEQIFQWINPIKVKSIKVVDGQAGYAQRINKATNFQTLDGFSVEIQRINLSPERIKSAENNLPVENISIKAHNYKFQSPDSIYTLKLDSLFYASNKKFLTARYFQLSPDYELHNFRVENDIERAHRNLFRISTDQFMINDFDLIKAYNNDKYAFGEVVLTSPELAILQDKNVEKDKSKENANEGQSEKNSDETSAGEEEALKQSVQKEIDKYVDIFKIATFQIEDANFLFEIQKKDSVRESQELDHLSLEIENLELGDLQANDLTKAFLVKEIELLLKDYNFIMPDSLYELRVNRLEASLAGQYIRIDSVNFEPLFLIEEYADKLDYAQDRFDISAGDIDIEGINFAEFFNNQNYFVGNILIDGLNGSIYRDSRVEQDPNRSPQTVQQLIKDIPIPLKVDTLNLKNALVKYSEVIEDGAKPSITTLANTNLQVINITNDSATYVLKDKLRASATSSFLGESKLSVDFDFFMNHPDDLYTYEGSLEQMKFEELNPLLTNIIFVKMESGMIEKLDFSVTATKHRSEGVLHFPYQNFRFKLLSRDDPGDPGFLLKAANWSLNNILIKSNNPGKLFNKYRKGTIEVDRNYSKSVFNHMGNSLLSGFISSTIPEPTVTIVYFFSDLP